MNLIKSFESRVAEVLGAAPQGYTAPFSFRKLARAAARQMEAETLIIDGVDTAPALYTVLVSPSDDIAMRPLYGKLSKELVSLIKAQAKTKRYVFVGEPLARFLVDPQLRSGKFDVFAENIDAPTLERLRAEERSFLMGASAVGGAAADRSDRRASLHGTRRPTRRGTSAQQAAHSANAQAARGAHAPQAQAEAPDVEPIASAAHSPAASGGLIPIVAPTPAPLPSIDEEASMVVASVAPANVSSTGASIALAVPPVIPEPGAEPVASTPAEVPEIPDIPAIPAIPAVPTVPASIPGPDDSASMGLDIMPADVLDEHVSASSLSIPKIPTIDVPVTQRRIPAVEAPEPDLPDPGFDEDDGQLATCLLVDHQTGRTYLGSAPVTVIGRERGTCGIVLLDPNVSRRHAELLYDESTRSWRLHDLGSTNGSLVNDVEVAQCVLHDGDLLTIGLMNLEFKESS